MNDAEKRLAAAALLRQRAEKVPPWARAEPWQVVQTDSEYMDGVQIGADRQIGGEFAFAIETHSESLADYIATVHPGVGLKLANLLEQSVLDGIGVEMFGFLEDALDDLAAAILASADQHDAGRPT
jgi:hypothetical protein